MPKSLNLVFTPAAALMGVAIGLATLAPHAHAASVQSQTLAAFQENFVAQEWNQLNCDYASLLVARDIINEGSRESSFQPLSPANCELNRAHLNSTLVSPLWTNAIETPAFPNYLQIAHRLATSHAQALQAVKFSTAPEAPLQREELKPISVDVWTIENQLRSQLGVEDGHALKANCAWKSDAQSSLTEARAHLYDRTFWHAELFEQGYDCTISRFKAASQNLNSEKGFGSAQAMFEAARLNVKQVPHAKMNAKALAGLHVAVFPQLAYDSPTTLERLSYPKLKKDLEALGATLDVVNRVSASPAAQQIADSRAALEKIVAKYPNSKILVLTRSMGGMVAREVLERNPNLLARVSGVVEIGSTPFGSVIADYKARGDAFDQNFIERHDWKEEAAVAALGWLKPEFKALHDAALKRNNIATMSFRLFSPAASSQKNLDLPVVNVIQLPDSLGHYFGFKQSVMVDPAMLLMSIYGPTEGSSPMTHAAWDTKHSVRVFAPEFNHLGFWGLDPDLATDYIIASLQTAKKIGAW